ncbi:aquaporin-like protein [Annulohypoxylon moriforme]|nr:aquaporin-like protein [Annulohypoxylon moriforme]
MDSSKSVIPTTDQETQTEDFLLADILNTNSKIPVLRPRSSTLSTINSTINSEQQRRRRLHEVVWIDDGYLDANPGYYQKAEKPIFSLAQPFPHLIRWHKKADGSKRPVPEADDLAELGQANLSNISPPLGERTALGVISERASDTHDTDESNKDKCHNYEFERKSSGQQERDEVEQGEDPDRPLNWWARIRAKHPKIMAEFLATLVAIFLGLAANLSVNLSNNQPVQYGSYETTCWAWGFAWMFGIYLGGGVSGAHMNPAISICLVFFRGFPGRSCVAYVIAQFLASITAGALVWGIYKDSIYYADPTMIATSRAFFSTPEKWIPLGTAFLNQIVGGAAMMIAVFALGNNRTNNSMEAGSQALALGLLLTTLRFALGFNVGSALNPASDFGPRLVLWAVGYPGSDAFGNSWWIIGPWIATLVGSIIGCTIYDGLVFVGTESPINYPFQWDGDGVRRRARKFFHININE